MDNNLENIKAILFDLSGVLLFVKDREYRGKLNPLHQSLLSDNPNYSFADYFFLDKELLAALRNIQGKRLIIFTSGTIQDMPEIQNELNQVFERIYSAGKLGISKTDPNSYLKLCREIGLEPSEILLVDDNNRNIQAAGKAGLQTYLFTDSESLMGFLHLN